MSGAAKDRALRLREWAQALDGSRLHRLLAEIASPRASVAMSALDASEELLQGLPAAEARVGAERELALLRPLAGDAPQLTALAALQLALGRPGEALASARSAAARNSHWAPAMWLVARLEQEPALQQIALQGLRAQARELGAAHAAAARAGDAAALADSCAALRASERAALNIAEARPEAMLIRRQIEEGARASGAHPSADGDANVGDDNVSVLCAPAAAGAAFDQRLEAAPARSSPPVHRSHARPSSARPFATPTPGSAPPSGAQSR